MSCGEGRGRAEGNRAYTDLLQFPRSLEDHDLVRRVCELRRQRGGQASQSGAHDEDPDPARRDVFHLESDFNLVSGTIIREETKPGDRHSLLYACCGRRAGLGGEGRLTCRHSSHSTNARLGIIGFIDDLDCFTYAANPYRETGGCPGNVPSSYGQARSRLLRINPQLILPDNPLLLLLPHGTKVKLAH